MAIPSQISQGNALCALPSMEVTKAALVGYSCHFHPLERRVASFQRSNSLRFSVKATKEGDTFVQSEGNGKRKWKRRRLKKEDIEWQSYREEPPAIGVLDFTYRAQRRQELVDASILLTRSENRFELVKELAAEAAEMMDNDPDAFVDVHPALKVMTDRMKEAGYERPDGYVEDLFGTDEVIV